MKFFVCFALIAVAGCALASPASSGSSSSISSSNQGGIAANADSESETSELGRLGYGDVARFRKSAYGGSSGGYGGAAPASIQAPPCPKNYLFSCQPSLAPVPCSAPAAASYGSAGAYSAPVATYVNPSYGVPQHQQQYYGAAYVPQNYGYNY
ncbi:vitelline membrane protein Vm26Aa [Scaptodrosophila lebanonensis]|uniref:Vitelline membrane protein Vm26Aa n=1 Tax=Drosophila lebanonensis TaxID=7225 RepID=A0A6J2TR92_DROLE|nr:vitelline membrane protein Vm26Aa [Scaptodrosophila lebanonensis]